MSPAAKSTKCYMCFRPFREAERSFTVVATPLGGTLGKDVQVCASCFLDIAESEEGATR